MSIYHRIALLNTTWEAWKHRDDWIEFPIYNDYIDLHAASDFSLENTCNNFINVESSPAPLAEGMSGTAAACSTADVSSFTELPSHLEPSDGDVSVNFEPFTDLSEHLVPSTTIPAVMAALNRYSEYRDNLAKLGRAVDRLKSHIVYPKQKVSTNVARAFKPILQQIHKFEECMMRLEADDQLAGMLDVARKSFPDQQQGRDSGATTDVHMPDVVAREDADAIVGADADIPIIAADAPATVVAEPGEHPQPAPQCPTTPEVAEVKPTADKVLPMGKDMDWIQALRAMNESYATHMSSAIRSFELAHGRLSKLAMGESADVSKATVHELGLLRFGDEYRAWLEGVMEPWAALGGTLFNGQGMPLY